MQLGRGDTPAFINRASFITILLKAIGFEAKMFPSNCFELKNFISFCLFRSVLNLMLLSEVTLLLQSIYLATVCFSL